MVRSLWSAHLGQTRPAAAALDAVVARYAEPHRRYHGLRHLERVVIDTDRLGRALELPDRSAVVAAAFFHDAVYDARSATNESDSADLAGVVLGTLGWPEPRIGEVGRLVMATADHRADDLAASVLLDADLAVLGADPAVYDTYVRGVRTEFAHVPEAGWITGRADVLRRFLDRPTIYRTEPCRLLEARARANLTTELARLGQ